MSAEAIAAIIEAIIASLGLTQMGKKLLERLLAQGLPLWVKQYALPILAALAMSFASGSVEPFGALPAQGITIPVLVGLLASGIYRLIKGAPDPA